MSFKALHIYTINRTNFLQKLRFFWSSRNACKTFLKSIKITTDGTPKLFKKSLGALSFNQEKKIKN